MSKTSIEWTDRTVNPIRARLGGHTGHHCVKVSAGCANCYSSRMQSRFKMPPFQADQRRDVEVFFDESRLLDVLRRHTPTKWFWCDMTDLFGEWVPDEWIDRCFAVMALAPQHVHQVLTKRPERMRAYLLSRNGYSCGIWFAAEKVKPSPPPRHWYHTGRSFKWPLPNVWAGASIEDQPTADQRIPELLQTPAAVRFVSAEPLLGPVDFGKACGLPIFRYADKPIEIVDGLSGRVIGMDPSLAGTWGRHDARPHPWLDLVIVGGESGPKARPCDVTWIRSVVEQCRVATVPCFVKQDSGRFPGQQGRIPDELWIKEWPHA